MGPPAPHAHGRRVRDAVPALLAAITCGISVPAIKVVFVNVPRLLASGWLYFSAGLGLALWIAVTQSLSAPKPAVVVDGRVRRSGRVALVLATLCGAVIGPYALLRGVEQLSGQTASLLLELEVVLTPLVAVIWFHERLSAPRWAGAALVLVGGVACAVGPVEASAEPPTSVAGAAWIAVACLAWAVDSNLMRLLVHRPPLAVSRDKGLLGGALSLAVAGALGHLVPLPSPRVLILGAGVGVIAVGISVALYVASLRRLETAVTGAIFGTSPFIGAVLSWLFLGERPGPFVLAAGVLMAAGLVLLARPDGTPAGKASGPAGAA